MDASFLWDMRQALQIHQVRSDIRQANDEVRRARNENLDLDTSLERLALTCRAMWELLSEQLSLSEEALIDRVREIDLRDGRADGRMTSVPRPCSNCARINGSARPRCLYCGATLDGPQAFQPG